MSKQPLDKHKEAYTKRYLLFRILQRLEGRIHTKVEGLRSDMDYMFTRLTAEDMGDRFTTEYLEKEFDDVRDTLVSCLNTLRTDEINREISENDKSTPLNFWDSVKRQYCEDYEEE